MRNFEKPKISTGNKAFNEWLNGGYEKEIITCFYGPYATGKTNFCLMALAELLKKGKRSVYIDTEASFSFERIKQIMGKDYSKDRLKNVVIIKPTNFKEQIDAFNKLLRSVRDKQIDAIFVDSIVMLYRLELGLVKEEGKELDKNIEREKIRKVNLALARQLRLLSEIARKKKIPVIVTNQVYQDFEGNLHMVGGDLLRYWSKCLIKLEHLGDKRKAILVKHRSLPQKEFTYRITEQGIEKVRRFLF